MAGRQAMSAFWTAAIVIDTTGELIASFAAASGGTESRGGKR